MRVAVFEPLPRTCGVTAWAFNLAHGFRQLGHDCDVVSFTKSGRARSTRGKHGGARLGWQWWQDEPDVVARWADAPDVLDSYDLVVLNEPKNGTLDSAAKRAGIEPEYITALRQTTVPWLSALHDARSYDKVRAPHLEATVTAGNFTGTLIECRPGSYANASWALDGHVRQLQSWPWLPYRQRGVPADVLRERVIGMGGRVTPHKGFPALAYVAAEFPAAWHTRFFGPEPGGMGAAFTFRLYEALVRHHGWTGYRAGNPENFDGSKQRQEDRDINNWGSVNAAWPWYLERTWAPAGGELATHHLLFEGAYTDALATWARCAVGIQLSTDEVVTTFEYTTLEALDAGCLLVLPTYYTKDFRGAGQSFDIEWLAQYGRVPASLTGKRGIVWDDEVAAKEVVTAVTRATERIEAGDFDRTTNQRAIATYHDPRHLAGRILELI